MPRLCLQFIQLCVLCGCDYCPSIPGVGIVTAYKFVETHKSPIEVRSSLHERLEHTRVYCQQQQSCA